MLPLVNLLTSNKYNQINPVHEILSMLSLILACVFLSPCGSMHKLKSFENECYGLL